MSCLGVGPFFWRCVSGNAGELESWFNFLFVGLGWECCSLGLVCFGFEKTMVPQAAISKIWPEMDVFFQRIFLIHFFIFCSTWDFFVLHRDFLFYTGIVLPIMGFVCPFWIFFLPMLDIFCPFEGFFVLLGDFYVFLAECFLSLFGTRIICSDLVWNP